MEVYSATPLCATTTIACIYVTAPFTPFPSDLPPGRWIFGLAVPIDKGRGVFGQTAIEPFVTLPKANCQSDSSLSLFPGGASLGAAVISRTGSSYLGVRLCSGHHLSSLHVFLQPAGTSRGRIGRPPFSPRPRPPFRLRTLSRVLTWRRRRRGGPGVVLAVDGHRSGPRP